MKKFSTKTKKRLSPDDQLIKMLDEQCKEAAESGSYYGCITAIASIFDALLYRTLLILRLAGILLGAVILLLFTRG